MRKTMDLLVGHHDVRFCFSSEMCSAQMFMMSGFNVCEYYPYTYITDVSGFQEANAEIFLSELNLISGVHCLY